MPGGDAGEKTEKATPKKRRDQRKEGNVFQSKDVITVVSLFGSFYMLKLLFPKIYETVRAFMIDFIGYAGTVTDTSQGQIDEVASRGSCSDDFTTSLDFCGSGGCRDRGTDEISCFE